MIKVYKVNCHGSMDTQGGREFSNWDEYYMKLKDWNSIGRLYTRQKIYDVVTWGDIRVCRAKLACAEYRALIPEIREEINRCYKKLEFTIAGEWHEGSIPKGFGRFKNKRAWERISSDIVSTGHPLYVKTNEPKSIHCRCVNSFGFIFDGE